MIRETTFAESRAALLVAKLGSVAGKALTP